MIGSAKGIVREMDDMCDVAPDGADNVEQPTSIVTHRRLT